MTLGAIFGVMIAATGAFLRARRWSVVREVGKVFAFVLLFVVLVLGVLLALKSGTSSGDAAMYAAMFLVVGALGAVALLFVAGLIAAVIGKAIKRPWWAITQTLLAEIAVVGAVLWAYQSKVTVPAQSSISEASWKRELARRKDYEKNDKLIPGKYRDVSIEMIEMREAQRREMAKRGFVIPRMVPPEVEEAIRNRERARNLVVVPSPSQPSYGDLQRELRNTGVALGLAWLIGALGVPWMLPRPQSIAPPPPLG